VPRTFILGGKAAPGYWMAKLIIKLINNVAKVVNNDKKIQDQIKVIFLENYRVSLAEKIFPASDISEQISTAGTEASGTGCMKFMMNGALTIGTLDGANIEMADAVGRENIFIFGADTYQVAELQKMGYKAQNYIDKSPVLKEIFHAIRSNMFSPDEPGIFNPLLDSLINHDRYLVCADFEHYSIVQSILSKCYENPDEWTQKAIVNVARSVRFSSDRTIAEYARDIWQVPVESQVKWV